MEISDSSDTARPLLAGRYVCCTGRFVTGTRDAIEAVIRTQGGHPVTQPNRLTTMVVVGDAEAPINHRARPTLAIRKAEELLARGYTIRFRQEREFLRELGVDDGERQRFTIGDLTQLIGVSSARLRFWVRSGLLKPTETRSRLQFFDFRDVNHAKRIANLIADGVSLSEIRGGLNSLAQWLPGSSLPYSQLETLESDGRLRVRLESGLFGPKGQRLFDFDSELNASTLQFPAECDSLEDLFDAALAAEDGREYSRAIACYQRAIKMAPREAILHFNLGNVLHAKQAYSEAAESFRSALDHAPDYAEAWNNLGAVFAAIGQKDNAIQAYERALQLIPDYQHARDNLSAIQGNRPAPTLRIVR